MSASLVGSEMCIRDSPSTASKTTLSSLSFAAWASSSALRARRSATDALVSASTSCLLRGAGGMLEHALRTPAICVA
eukprot:8945841-Alexandrium_andersonii.AAC.1